MVILQFRFRIILALLLLFLASCAMKPDTEQLSKAQAPMLTKDEVARVDGRPLTIAGFLTIRSKVPTLSDESAIWVGLASLALQNQSRASGKEITPQTAVTIARYALRDITEKDAAESLRSTYSFQAASPSPDRVRNHIESLLKHSVIQRSHLQLSQFR